MMVLRYQISFAVFVLLSLTTLSVSGEQCERLKSTLSYTQETAPRDLSRVLPVVVERVNKELEGVVDVEVEWTGSDLHGRVGDHMIQCKVTRLFSAITSPTNPEATTVDSQGRQVIVQCFTLSFTILDTDECVLPRGHAMRHKCQEPAMCVNTIGSYECICPRLGESLTENLEGDDVFWKKIAGQTRSPWELSYASISKSSCPSSASTKDCCPALGHTPEGKSCRAAFSCPKDPCVGSSNTCASNARCVRHENPLSKPTNHDCVCQKGLMGNGRACHKGDVKPKPMVKYDGVTPTEETLKNNYYCGCTKPEVDACAGFAPCEGNHQICTVTSGNTPMCVCKPGYVDNQDGYGCVDESPPILKLLPDGKDTMTLRQGDFYKEYAVDVIDENAEEYLRSLRIAYSQPLPPGCLVNLGSFHINYTVATPWTSYQFVRITRNVIVNDIDECTLDVKKYSEICPQLIPQCHDSAKCVNTIGSYTCQCPKYTTGDGFKKISSGVMPEGYQGGSGCVDTSKPVITIKGPNPKIIKVCKCGVMAGRATTGDEAICAQQRSSYGKNLKDLIDATLGAELCSTHSHPNPKPSDCVKAFDHTYMGDVDLTPRVVVGSPVEKSPLQWSVPYNVVDAAGNHASTAWRDVVVEEVDIGDLEAKIRREVMAAKDAEIQNAVLKAVAEERSKHVNNSQPSKARSECRACPVCPQCKESPFDPAKECAKYCQGAQPGTCPTGAADFWAQFDGNNPLINLMVLGCFIVVLRFIITLWFNPGAIFGRTNYDYMSGTAPLVPAIAGPPTTPTTPGQYTTTRDPSYSDPLYGAAPRGAAPIHGGLFSPQSSRMHYVDDNRSGTPFSSTSPYRSQDADVVDIYADVITPSSTGDYRGVRR